MKSTFFALALILLTVSCSKIEIAEDPVLGIWKQELQTTITAEGVEIKAQEWIFNDLYKGRFHGYVEGEIVYEMDYHWYIEGNVYTLTYNGGDLADITFQMLDNRLVDMQGNIIASRQ